MFYKSMAFVAPIIPGYYVWLAYKDTYLNAFHEQLDEQDYWGSFKGFKPFLFLIALFVEFAKLSFFTVAYYLFMAFIQGY
ncbi:hypothetical protein IPG41_01930 [Candidatus Peregrinibacteria bacterium]|nr:MAG: hypothetical protein IPG41_01930 [Candidatus Peregrinibacteria bacterium]